MYRILALAGLALVVAATGAPVARAAFPGANGRIAFSAFASREDAVPPTRSESIDVAQPSGRGRQSLRYCSMVEAEPDRGDCSIGYGSPAWSPSGARLAFDAGTRIALMNRDGSGFRLLNQQTADDGEPAWSPDGTRLVFSGPRTAGGPRDVYVLNLRRGAMRRLTFRGGRSPAWSVRGRIAFVRGSRGHKPGLRPGTGDIYTVRAGGRALRRITFHGGADPAWSPHGTRLAFARQRRYGPFSLYAVRASGRGLKRLPTAEGGGSPEHPAWSPDGRWIAYESFDNGVWVQRLDGTRARQVAYGAVGGDYSIGAFGPDWQPVRASR